MVFHTETVPNRRFASIFGPPREVKRLRSMGLKARDVQAVLEEASPRSRPRRRPRSRAEREFYDEDVLRERPGTVVEAICPTSGPIFRGFLRFFSGFLCDFRRCSMVFHRFSSFFIDFPVGFHRFSTCFSVSWIFPNLRAFASRFLREEYEDWEEGDDVDDYRQYTMDDEPWEQMPWDFDDYLEDESAAKTQEPPMFNDSLIYAPLFLMFFLCFSMFFIDFRTSSSCFSWIFMVFHQQRPLRSKEEAQYRSSGPTRDYYTADPWARSGWSYSSGYSEARDAEIPRISLAFGRFSVDFRSIFGRFSWDFYGFCHRFWSTSRGFRWPRRPTSPLGRSSAGSRRKRR